MLHCQPLPETVALVEDIVVDYVTDMVSLTYYYPVLFFRRGFGVHIFLHKAFHFAQFIFFQYLILEETCIWSYFLSSSTCLGAQSSGCCNQKGEAFDGGLSVLN